MILIGLILLVAAVLVAVELVLANRNMPADQGRVRLSFLGHHEWLHAWALLAIGAGVLLVAVIGYSMIQHGIRVRVRRRRERKRLAAENREQDEREREEREREEDQRRQLTGPDDGYGATSRAAAAPAAGFVATERSALSHDDLERDEPYGGYYSRDAYAAEPPAGDRAVFRQQDSFSHHDDPVGTAGPDASATDRTEQFVRPDLSGDTESHPSMAPAAGAVAAAGAVEAVREPDRSAPAGDAAVAQEPEPTQAMAAPAGPVDAAQEPEPTQAMAAPAGPVDAAQEPEPTQAMAAPTPPAEPAAAPEATQAMAAPAHDPDRTAAQSPDTRPADAAGPDDATPPQGTEGGHFPPAVDQQLGLGEYAPAVAATEQAPPPPSVSRAPGAGDGNVREQLRTGDVTPDLSPEATLSQADTTAAYTHPDPESLRGHAQRRLADPTPDTTAAYTGDEYHASGAPDAPRTGSRPDDIDADDLGPDDGVHQR